MLPMFRFLGVKCRRDLVKAKPDTEPEGLDVFTYNYTKQKWDKCRTLKRK